MLSLQKNTVSVPTIQNCSRRLKLSPKDPEICSKRQKPWD